MAVVNAIASCELSDAPAIPSTAATSGFGHNSDAKSAQTNASARTMAPCDAYAPAFGGEPASTSAIATRIAKTASTVPMPAATLPKNCARR